MDTSKNNDGTSQNKSKGQICLDSGRGDAKSSKIGRPAKHPVQINIAPWHMKQENLAKTFSRDSLCVPKVKTTITTNATKPKILNQKSSVESWPSQMSEYVDKCFRACSNDAERLFVEAKLKILINKTIDENRLKTTDWAQLPLVPVSEIQENTKINKTSVESQSRNMSFISKNDSQEEERATILMNIEDGPLVDKPVQGTSLEIEKEYFRLTSAPDPSTVRPYNVLKKALKHVEKKWKEGADYVYLCSQLKSIRQDLTVQLICNRFTVHVYEVHARIALEKEDVSEFNQCLTRIIQLYDAGLEGAIDEFTGYQITYLTFTKNYIALNDILAKLHETIAPPTSFATLHALSIRRAFFTGNTFELFKLFINAPNMSPHLMKLFMKLERASFFEKILLSYKPHVSIVTLLKIFGNECHGLSYIWLEAGLHDYDFHEGLLPTNITHEKALKSRLL